MWLFEFHSINNPMTEKKSFKMFDINLKTYLSIGALAIAIIWVRLTAIVESFPSGSLDEMA